MSSSQAQRQERLQARLRGAGNAAFTGAFSFTLPQEPSPAQETAPAPAPAPASLSLSSVPGPKEPTPRRRTPKQTPRQTPPRRASPRLTSYAAEASTRLTTRPSSHLSVVSPLEQQRQHRQTAWDSSGQKRKRSDIATDRDLDTPTERTITRITASDSNSLTTLLSSPVVATHGPIATITTVTPRTRSRRTRRPSLPKLVTPQDDDETRLHVLESKRRAARFTSPRRENSFTGLDNAMRGYEDEDGVILNAASGVLDDMVGGMEDVPVEGEDDSMEAGGLLNVEWLESGEVAVGNRDKYMQLEEPADEASFSVVIAGSPQHKKHRKDPPEDVHKGEVEEVYDEGNGATDNPATEPPPLPRVIAREPPPRKQQKPPSMPTGSKSKEKPSRQKGTIEITVQRLSKPNTGTQYTPNIPITPLDILSQIFKEMFKKQYELLDSNTEKWALEVFADEVEVRLLDHVDTLNAAIQASRELRRYTRLRQQNCEMLMALRQELGQIELEIDEVRRKHERENRESKNKHTISQRLDSIAAAMELSKARAEAKPDQPIQLEGQVDLLLRKLAREVTTPRLRSHRRMWRRGNGRRGKVGFIVDGSIDYEAEGEEDDGGGGEGEEEGGEGEGEDDGVDEQQYEMGQGGDGLETGSILERVKGFNLFLEKMEKVVLEASLRGSR